MAPKRKATQELKAAAGSSKPKQPKPKAPLDEAFTRVTRSRAKQDSRLTRSISKAELPKKHKKAASTTSSASKKPKAKKPKAKEENGDEKDIVVQLKKTVIVEYCKQCSSFKTRATQVQEGLKNAVPEITVLLNPDKPRKGCFEIRDDGGKKFVSLLDMKRPFKPMKDLDMEKVISDLIEKIKS